MKIAKKEDLWRINESKSYDWKCTVDLEGAGQGVGKSAAFLSVGLGDQSKDYVGEYRFAGRQVGDPGGYFVCWEADHRSGGGVGGGPWSWCCARGWTGQSWGCIIGSGGDAPALGTSGRGVWAGDFFGYSWQAYFADG